MNEKTKKILTLLGYLLLGIFVVGIVNLFFGVDEIQLKPEKNRQLATFDSVGMEKSMPVPESGGSVSSLSQDSAEAPLEIGDKIIKNGNLDLRVKEIDPAVEKIGEIVRERNGEVYSSNFYERIEGQKSGNILVRVPNENFEETFSQLKNIATHVSNESISARDVTEQYSDLELQIRNKKAEEESFLQILDGAVEVEDVLQVTKELARVRGEIERLEGRLRFLENQVEMSSINISLSEDVSLSAGRDWRPWEVIKNSFRTLIENVQGFVNNVINFIIVVLPVAVLYSALIFIVYRAGKYTYHKFFKK